MSYTNEIEKYLREKAKANRQAITVNLELLPACNLDCKMCFIRSSWSEIKNNGGLIGKDKWLEMAKELKSAGVLFLLLTGGEVFIYPEFKELYIELYKMGFVLTINTNATLINEEVVSWLKMYPPKCVSISLYGSNDELYYQLCGKHGMFERVNHSIELLLNESITVELKTMCNPINIDDLDNCRDYASKHGVAHDYALYCYPPVRKLVPDHQIRLSADEYVYYMNLIENKYDEEVKRKHIIERMKKYINTPEGNFRVCGMHCAATNTSCWINWQGRLIACAMIDKPYTLPFEVGFKNAWKELQSIYDGIAVSDTCASCKLRNICFVCPAGAYCETGSISGTPDYHCQVTHTLFKQFKEYVEKHHINLDEYDENGEKI